ncbi:MAG: alkaline phosphatase PhoX [Saprospiraceae bacterium]
MKRLFILLTTLLMLGHLGFSQVKPIDSSGVYAPIDPANSVQTMTKGAGLHENLIFQHDENWVKLRMEKPLIQSAQVYAPLNVDKSVQTMTKAPSLRENLIFQHDESWVKLRIDQPVIQSAQVYAPLDPSKSVQTMTKARGLRENLIFQHDESWVKVTREDGYTAVRKSLEGQDFMHYIPDPASPNTKGTLVINHEIFTSMEKDTVLGFGGSMSIVKVEKKGDDWGIVIDPVLGDTSVAVDFSPVGFTTSNCGGAVLPNGRILTGEEIFNQFNINDNVIDPVTKISAVLKDGGRFGYDATDSTYTIPASYPEFGGMKIPFDANFGWMTEIDPNTAKAVMKHYHMGRFSHEGGVALDDNRTVILTDDFAGACLFKFVADVPGDYTAGNLYAFKQNPDSYTGTWVQIDRNMSSLINARKVAAEKGATLFMRLEWPSYDPETDEVYLSETGRDITSNQAPVGQALNWGATLPRHWTNDIAPGDEVFYDATQRKVDMPYGTILKLSNATSDNPEVKPFIRGGFNSTRTFCFNSVDGQTITKVNNKKYLVVTEDNIGTSRGRISPNYVGSYPFEYPKAFMLDLSIPNPTKDDMLLVVAGSRDTELTGAVFTPDGNTMFVVNQHPSLDDNVPPYHKAAVFAFSGFKAGFTSGLKDLFVGKSGDIKGYPNPAVDVIYLEDNVSGMVFDLAGKSVHRIEERNFINLANYTPGVYVLKTDDGRTLKFVVQ